MGGENGEFTEILHRAGRGDDVAREEIARLACDALREIAARSLQRETPGMTVQPTVLADEALMRLLGRNGEKVSFVSRAHFFSIAARDIRQLIIREVVRRKAMKRGREWERVTIDSAAIAGRNDDGSEDILAVHDTLERFERIDPLGASIVEKRFFGGMTMEQIAAALDTPLRTVERKWTAARAWLRKELAD